MTPYFLVLILACALNAQPVARGPFTLKLGSGKQIQVVGITVTELNVTNEKAAVLRYITEVDFDNDLQGRSAELDGIWDSFRPTLEKAGIRVIVFEICDKPSGLSPLNSVTKSRGIVLKRGKDGEWRRPPKGDKGLVPKQSPGSPEVKPLG